MDDRDAKDRVLLEGQKACILISAAGAVALFALLQAVWTSGGALSLKKGILWGIVAFAFGIAVPMLGYLARHWAIRKNQTNSGLFFKLVHIWIPLVTVGCILLGLVFPVIGGFDSLNSDRTGQISIRRR
jgi:predicted cobalt transporter CbtA